VAGGGRIPPRQRHLPGRNSLADGTRQRPAEHPCATPSRGIYLLADLILILVSLWGFRHFYFHGMAYPGRPITPGICTLAAIPATVSRIDWISFLYGRTWLAPLFGPFLLG
jgi:hypothetical protein